MKLFLFLLMSFMIFQTYAQKVPENDEIRDINLRLDDAGYSLQQSARLSSIGLFCAVIGPAITVFALSTESNELAAAGTVISVASIPFTIGSLAKLNRAGRELQGTFPAEKNEWEAIESESGENEAED